MVMTYEADTTFRQICTDRRKHPGNPQPAWLGYSVGKWEGHMEVQATIDDPKVNQRLIPDTDLMETYCSENEEDAAHLAAAK